MLSLSLVPEAELARVFAIGAAGLSQLLEPVLKGQAVALPRAPRRPRAAAQQRTPAGHATAA